MTYTPPGPAFLKGRLAAFTDVPDATVQMALDEAADGSGSGWPSTSLRAAATVYLAAHILTTWGHGSGVEAAAFRDGTEGFTSMSDGGVSVSRTINTGSGSSQFDRTQYGREYRALLKRAIFPVVVGGSDYAPPVTGLGPWE